MAADVSCQVMEKMLQTKWLIFQLDESMDILNEAQLVVFVRVADDVEILEGVLFC